MSEEMKLNLRKFRVYNGQAIVGYVYVPAGYKDVLAAAERRADENYGLWDRLDEVDS